MAMSGTQSKSSGFANLVAGVVALHIVTGLWLMWDSGKTCGDYLVEFSGSPQQVMSRLAWHWPHVITTEGIVWPYIVATVLVIVVVVMAFVGSCTQEGLSGSEAFRAAAMVAPLLTLVTMEIFVAVGTYGAMTAGRSEDPDEKMNFWVAEAFGKMEGPVDRNTNLVVGAVLILVAFAVVSVGTVALAGTTYGLGGMVSDPTGEMPVTAVLQLFLFPGAVMLATEAATAAKHVDRVFFGPNDSYMLNSAVLDFCSSTSWIEATVTEPGMVALYVFALATPVALGLALATIVFSRGDGPAAAAARMVALVASACFVALTAFIFSWQKFSHCVTVPITPAFAYYAPFFTTVGVAVLAMTAVGIVDGYGEGIQRQGMVGSYAGYFSATKTTSFM
jgi:hypothetical protein